jgi:tRNA (cmo5U34)-methyltransferase
MIKKDAEPTAVDQTMPKGRWEFDSEVTDVFDDMLSRSIPDHDEMRRLCFELGSKFVQPKTAVVDLGCSRGAALAPFVDKFGALVRHVGVEVSAPMLEAARKRFSGYINAGVVDVRDMDLRTSYPPENASVTLLILTLQFVPIEHRQRLLRSAFRRTVEGGCLILVEKVLGDTADLDELFVSTYLDHKRSRGYTEDQIARKRLSLEGVLVPVTAAWNVNLLHAAGFRQVDSFWRRLNFAGWIAIKDGE